MNDNDLTLIIDLVGGRLSSGEERAALDRIAADPELRTAYESQMAVAARLETATLPSMTPSERDRLHATLKTQLHLEDAPAASARIPSRMSRWFAPLTGLAVAAVIIGAVVVLPGVLQDGRSDGSLEIASASTTTSPSAADTGSVRGSTPPDTAAPVTTPLDPAAAAPLDDEPSNTATGASPESATTPPVPFVANVKLDELAASFSSNPTLLASDLRNRSAAGTPAVSTGEALSCAGVVATGAGDSVVVPLVVTTYDGAEAIVMAVTPSSAEPYLVVYSITSCEKLADTRG